MDMIFNMNQNVKVKLTKIGINELERQHDELKIQLPKLGDFSPPIVDNDGYSTFQMWSLMNCFGYMFSPGSDMPFHTDIILVDAK